MVRLSQASAELAGIPVRGSLTLADTKTRKIAIVLEGHEVDTRWFGLERINLSDLAKMFKPASSTAAQTSPDEALEKSPASLGQPNWLRRADDNLSLRIKAGVLTSDGPAFRDVAADITLANGVITIPHIELKTKSGLELELDGQLSLETDQPKGIVNWIVAASDAEAIEEAIEMLSGDASTNALKERARRFAPLRLAGVMRLADNKKNATNIDVDGTVQNGRMVANMQLGGGMAAWRTSHADITASFQNPDITRIFEQLLNARSSSRNTRRTARAGRGLIKAIGTPDAGMAGLIEMKGEGLSVTYRGRFRTGDSGLESEGGNVAIDASDSTDILALVGLPIGEGAAGTPMKGSVALTIRDNELTFAPRDLLIGQSRLGGTIALKAAEDDNTPLNVSADLIVAQASLPALLSPLLSARSSAAQAGSDTATPADQQGSGETGAAKDTSANSQANPDDVTPSDAKTPRLTAAPVFPDKMFDFDALAGLTGTLNVKVHKLIVAPGMAMHSSSIEAILGPDRVDVKKLSGRALGGTVDATLDLVRASAGIDVKGTLKVAGAQLRDVAGASAAPLGTAQTPSTNIAAAPEGVPAPVPARRSKEGDNDKTAAPSKKWQHARQSHHRLGGP